MLSIGLLVRVCVQYLARRIWFHLRIADLSQRRDRGKIWEQSKFTEVANGRFG